VHNDDTIILTSSMMAGLVVCYARNFVSSDGMGPLGADYTNFDDLRMKEVHDSLMNSRHQIYAHRDLTSVGPLSIDDSQPRNAYDVFITFHDDLTGFDFDIASPQLSHLQIEEFIELFDLQSSRIRSDLKSSIEYCLKTGDYQPGVAYKLGVEFPATQTEQ